MEDLNKHFSLLKKAWPSTLVARSEVGRFSGGVVSPGYIANMDCRGLGPAERLRIGRKICYTTDALASWLQKKATKLGPLDK